MGLGLSAYFSAGTDANKYNYDAKNNKAGFQVYSLKLDEGISCNYRGLMTCWTTQQVSWDDVSDMLYSSVSLVISQMLIKDVTIKRSFCGIITKANYLGEVVVPEANNLSTSYYWYSFTLENEIALMRNNMCFNSFSAVSPLNVVTTMFNPYLADSSTKCDSSLFSSTLTNSYSKNKDVLLFDQGKSTDWDFIAYIMEIYGISFVFQHNAAAGSQGSVTLYLCDGSTFPAIKYALQDSSKSGTATSPDYTSEIPLDRSAVSDKLTAFRLDSWNLEVSTGIDYISLNAPFPDGDSGVSQHAGSTNGLSIGNQYNYYEHFHGYTENANHSYVTDDSKLIISAIQCRYNCLQKKATGSTDNILVMPASSIKVTKTGMEKDVSALVTRTFAYMQVSWPESQGGRLPGGEDNGEKMQVNFEAMPFKSGSENRYCCKAWSIEKEVL